jgi:hypothetical protein
LNFADQQKRLDSAAPTIVNEVAYLDFEPHQILERVSIALGQLSTNSQDKTYPIMLMRNIIINNNGLPPK